MRLQSAIPKSSQILACIVTSKPPYALPGQVLNLAPLWFVRAPAARIMWRIRVWECWAWSRFPWLINSYHWPSLATDSCGAFPATDNRLLWIETFGDVGSDSHSFRFAMISCQSFKDNGSLAKVYDNHLAMGSESVEELANEFIVFLFLFFTQIPVSFPSAFIPLLILLVQIIVNCLDLLSKMRWFL